MKKNILRNILAKGRPSLGTRLWSVWPFYMEALGSIGIYDYAEFVAEYAPYTQNDLENLSRAAELHGMGTIIKLDFLNREYMAQKAVAAGFQGILFADNRNAAHVRDSIQAIKPDTPEFRGQYGCPARRFIGTQYKLDQLDHAKRLNDVVLCFMIEKEEAMENLEAICSVPGVDMVQFGPADYCLSRGINLSEHREEAKAVEREMIQIALKHGVHPRCEIQSSEDAYYYAKLGVRHFCVGDQLEILRRFWSDQGDRMREIMRELI